MTDTSLGVRGRYQDPTTTMTLREGLDEYYRVNSGLSGPAKMKDERSATYFRNHDTTHVVFGTHTGLLDEALNDVLTFHGVAITPFEYMAGFVATDESKDIAKSTFTWEIFPTFWRALRIWPTARRAAKAMTKKWPWNQPQDLLDRPLNEIRDEFGIVPFRAEEVLRL